MDLTASDELFREYMEGACHVFAVALHRDFGWSFLLMTDEAPRERYAGGVPPVHHVYADAGNGILYDIRGAHDRDDVIAQWKDVEPTSGGRSTYGVR